MRVDGFSLLTAEEILLSGGQLNASYGRVVDDSDPYVHPTWLSSCSRIYLDIGSNRGVQVRKLFEPWKYKGAEVLRLFTGSFGPESWRNHKPSSETGICALGFEPNPNHHLRLFRLQRAYAARGWNVHFYPFAAWNAEVSVELYHNRWKSPYALTEPDAGVSGSTPLSWKPDSRTRHRTLARAVDMAMFLKSLPEHSVLLWKIDIEGAEWTVLPRLHQAEMLCHDTVETVIMEAHIGPACANSSWGDNWNCSVRGIKEKLLGEPRCRGNSTTFIDFDDNSYKNDVDDDLHDLGWWPSMLWTLLAALALLKSTFWKLCSFGMPGRSKKTC